MTENLAGRGGGLAGLRVLTDAWRYVDRRGPVPELRPDLGPCWLWVGVIDKTTGYGKFWCAGKNRNAHRVIVELSGVVIPKGKQVDHLCRRHDCVNPGHLDIVSNRENALRGVGPTAMNAKKTQCKLGHALTPDNIYSPPYRPNSRWCRVCCRIRRKRGKAKQRAKRAAQAIA